MTENKEFELSKQEIETRVAVLKRFKALLKEQRNKFNDYLVVLESQNKSIAEENVDAILHHTEVEQSIISEIFNIQKVIDPIEKIYKLANPGSNEQEVLKLKTDLNTLQTQVLEQNKKNRTLLQNRMNFLREELSSMKAVPKYKKNAYASSGTASYIDISL